MCGEVQQPLNSTNDDDEEKVQRQLGNNFRTVCLLSVSWGDAKQSEGSKIIVGRQWLSLVEARGRGERDRDKVQFPISLDKEIYSFLRDSIVCWTSLTHKEAITYLSSFFHPPRAMKVGKLIGLQGMNEFMISCVSPTRSLGVIAERIDIEDQKQRWKNGKVKSQREGWNSLANCG